MAMIKRCCYYRALLMWKQGASWHKICANLNLKPSELNEVLQQAKYEGKL